MSHYNFKKITVVPTAKVIKLNMKAHIKMSISDFS